MAINIGPKIGIEGEKEYRQQINNIIQTQKTLKSELNAISAEFENNANKQEYLRRTSEKLNKSVELQKNRLQSLKEQLAQATDKWGESATKTQRWKQAVADAEMQLAKMNKKLSDTKKELNNLKLEQASAKMKKFGDSIGTVADKTKAISLLSAGALTAITKGASDYVENFNKVQESFKEAADQVIEFSKNSAMNFGMDKSQTLEMASLYGDMGTSMGLAREEAAKMSISLVQLGADLASFKNMNISEVQTSLNSIFTGEAIAMKKLGVVMTEANLKAYALTKGMHKQYKEMSQAEKVVLRYNYVMDMTKNAQGDFVRNNEEAANASRMLIANIKDLAIDLGMELLPAVKSLLGEAVKITSKFNELDTKTKKAIVNAGLFSAALFPVTKGVATTAESIAALTKGLGALKAGVEVVSSSLAISAGAFGVLIGVVGGLSIAIAKCERDFRRAYEKSEIGSYLTTTQEGFDNLRKKVEETANSIRENSDAINGNSWADTAKIDTLGDRYLELSKKTKHTQEETAEMKSIAGQLTNIMPELAGRIDTVTGRYNGQIGTVAALIEKHKELAKAQAISNLLTKSYENEFNAKQQLNEAKRLNIEAKAKYKESQKQNDAINKNKIYVSNPYYLTGKTPTNYKKYSDLSESEKLAYSARNYGLAESAENKAVSKGLVESRKRVDLTQKEVAKATKQLKQSTDGRNKLLKELTKAQKKANSFKGKVPTAPIAAAPVSAPLKKYGGGGSSKSYKATAKKEIKKAEYEITKAQVRALRDRKQITLKEEVQIWKAKLKVVKKGSSDFDKIKKEITRSRAVYNKEQLKLDKEYMKNIKALSAETVKQIENNKSRYIQALNEKKSAIKQQFRLFDKYEHYEKKNPWELTQNLSSQVQGFKEWQSDLEKLKLRGVDNELLSQIKDLGVSAAADINAMTMMSDSELRNYVEVWKQFNLDMELMAEDEMKPMKEATEKVNKELEQSLQRQIKKANKKYVSELKKLGKDGSAAAKRAGKNTTKALLSGLKSQDAEITKYLQDLQEKVTSAFNFSATLKSTTTSTAKKKKIKKKADGGLVETGSLFMAGEKGAELIGTVNGKTMVANGNQMGLALAKSIEPFLNNILTATPKGVTPNLIVNLTNITQLDGREIDRRVTSRVINNISAKNNAYQKARGI